MAQPPQKRQLRRQIRRRTRPKAQTHQPVPIRADEGVSGRVAELKYLYFQLRYDIGCEVL
jgi:hypothetical protein